MAARPLLAAFRSAALSLSAPVQPPLSLRVVSCWVAVHPLGQGAGQGAPCTRTQTCRGNGATSAGPARCAGPRQDTPAGPPAKPPADPAGRPADRRERKQRTKPGERRQPTAPPGHLPPLAWPGGNSRSFPAAAAPVPPRGHQKRVSTLRPPFPPSPPSLLIGFASKAVGRD